MKSDWSYLLYSYVLGVLVLDLLSYLDLSGLNYLALIPSIFIYLHKNRPTLIGAVLFSFLFSFIFWGLFLVVPFLLPPEMMPCIIELPHRVDCVKISPEGFLFQVSLVNGLLGLLFGAVLHYLLQKVPAGYELGQIKPKDFLISMAIFLMTVGVGAVLLPIISPITAILPNNGYIILLYIPALLFYFHRNESGIIQALVTSFVFGFMVMAMFPLIYSLMSGNILERFFDEFLLYSTYSAIAGMIVYPVLRVLRDK